MKNLYPYIEAILADKRFCHLNWIYENDNEGTNLPVVVARSVSMYYDGDMYTNTVKIVSSGNISRVDISIFKDIKNYTQLDKALMNIVRIAEEV
jgi:hypothetical protein